MNTLNYNQLLKYVEGEFSYEENLKVKKIIESNNKYKKEINKIEKTLKLLRSFSLDLNKKKNNPKKRLFSNIINLNSYFFKQPKKIKAIK